MPDMASHVKSSQKRIEIDIVIDDELVSNSVLYSSTALIKYLLYQRQQIPLQIDALQNNLALAKKDSNMMTPSDSNGDNLDTKSLPPALARKKFMEYNTERKMLVEQQKKLALFNKKSGEFIENFTAIEKALETKIIKSGQQMRAVRIALGTNIMSAKEVYTLHIPVNVMPDSVKPFLIEAKNKINVAFLRSFFDNEEVSAVVDQNCSLLQMWILVLMPKECNSSTDDNDSAKSTQVPSKFKTRKLQNLSWIPRPNYKVLHIAQQIDINLMSHKNDVDNYRSPNGSFDENKRTKGRNRREFPSLSKRTKLTPDTSPVGETFMNDSLLEQLDEFEITPISAGAASPLRQLDREFLKPQRLTQQLPHKPQFFPCSSSDEHNKDSGFLEHCSTSYASVDMTPDNHQYGPATPYNGSRMPLNGDLTCNKRMPIPMEETPCASHRSSASNGTPNRVCSTVKTSLEQTNSRVWTPHSSRNFATPHVCNKVVPMIETPIASATLNSDMSQNYLYSSMQTPISYGTNKDNMTSTCFKVVPMEETPVVESKWNSQGTFELNTSILAMEEHTNGQNDCSRVSQNNEDYTKEYCRSSDRLNGSRCNVSLNNGVNRKSKVPSAVISKFMSKLDIDGHSGQSNAVNQNLMWYQLSLPIQGFKD